MASGIEILPLVRAWGKPLLAWLIWILVAFGLAHCLISAATDDTDTSTKPKSSQIAMAAEGHPELKLTEVARQLGEKLDSWAGYALKATVLLSAVGLVSMALVDLLKALLLVRPAYHWFMLEKWLLRNDRQNRAQVRKELFELTAGDERNRWVWLDQPAEKMLAQLQDAGHVALGRGSVHAALAGFLAGDVVAVKGEDVDKYLARRRFVARRRIDAFQTQLNWYWARGNQALAILVSFALLHFLLKDITTSLHYDARVAFGIAILGGLVAPYAKDLTRQLTRARSMLS